MIRSAFGIGILVVAAALFGSQFTPGAWYAALDKPSWTPPGWLFGPVWSVLYLMIAIAGWLAWQKREVTKMPVIFWGAQLLLNALWSYIFFGLHQPGIAFVEIMVLLAAILGFIGAAWPVSRAAALLFLPYAAWVAFAAVLNFSIWRLNV
jgi:translocator protein